MPIVRRRDDFLNEAIAALDDHLEIHKGNVARAFHTLAAAERKFVESEIFACDADDRYYMENYHVIKTEYEGLRTLWPFWDSQEIFYDEIRAARMRGLETGNYQTKLIVLKARQLGLSTVSEGVISHRTWYTEACNSLIVAQDGDQADYLFGMSRLAYDMLPWWMRPQERYQSKGRYLILDKKDPRERQRAPGLQSGIFVEAANAMTGVAVGKTMRNAHLSELSAWRYGGSILTTQILPSMNAPDLFAVMESTARNGKDGFWYKLWVDALEGKLDWRPVFIPFFKVRKYSIPLDKGEVFERTPEEEAIAKKVEEEDQFKLTDPILKWRRAKIAEACALNNDDDSLFYEQYPINWRQAFQSGGLCAFNKKKLQKMQDLDCCEPIWTGEVRLDPKTLKRPLLTLKKLAKGEKAEVKLTPGARLHIWEPPQPGVEYYIGADVAHGIEGGDFSDGQVMKVGRGQKKDVQVAEWHGWINPTPFAHVLAALGYWYNTAEVACEVNDCGRDVNNELFRVIEYPKLYQWKHLDKIKNFITDFFGWQTNFKTRNSLIRAMRESVDNDILVIRSAATIDEAMSFGAMEDGGRIEGMGDHDDRIMAWMICLYCAHDMDWGESRLGGEGTNTPPVDPSIDFQNTDFSPLHDKNGLQRQSKLNGTVPDEYNVYENVQNEPVVSEDERWKTW